METGHGKAGDASMSACLNTAGTFSDRHYHFQSLEQMRALLSQYEALVMPVRRLVFTQVPVQVMHEILRSPAESDVLFRLKKAEISNGNLFFKTTVSLLHGLLASTLARYIANKMEFEFNIEPEIVSECASVLFSSGNLKKKADRCFVGKGDSLAPRVVIEVYDLEDTETLLQDASEWFDNFESKVQVVITANIRCDFSLSHEQWPIEIKTWRRACTDVDEPLTEPAHPSCEQTILMVPSCNGGPDSIAGAPLLLPLSAFTPPGHLEGESYVRLEEQELLRAAASAWRLL